MSDASAIEQARAMLAAEQERLNPGWRFGHGDRGWTARRERDGKALTSSSMPGLLALVAVADSQ